MSQLTYSKYKACDVSWLGVIPSHWTALRLRHLLAQPISDGPHETPEFTDYGIPFLSVDGIQEGELVFENCRYISEDDHARFSKKAKPRIGDVLMGKAASTGKIAQVKVDIEFNVWSPLAILRPNRQTCTSSFMEYYLKSSGAQYEIERLCTNNTQKNISMADIPRVSVSLPPLDEQRAIADYLDRETARIDALIEEQLRLIELLWERRRVMRTEAVLRGIDAADTVASRSPWAEEISASWKVVPLTAVARLESGHTPSRTREDWWQNCYIPWISLNDVGAMRDSKYLQVTTHQLSDEGIANSSARLLPADTVVLSRDATVGRAAIMKIPMATSQHFAAWICGPSLDPEYLWALFTDAMQPHFDSFQNGSTIRTIGMGDLKAFRIPLPPIDEQRRIVAYLDDQTAKIDALIAETETFIELSRERRSALITGAVTGQIDVREVA